MLVTVEEGYRIWSAEYDSAPNPLLALEMRVLQARLGPMAGKTFMDAGAGTGRWMKIAAAHGATVFGIDISRSMLSVGSRDRTLSGRLVEGDLRRLPFADLAADIAMCSFTLGYVEWPAGVLKELARVSRCVIVSDLHPAAVEAGWKRSFRVSGRVYELENFRHSARDVDLAARAAGLAREWCVEPGFGESERRIFEAAKRPELFEAAAGLPAIRAVCWVSRAG